MIFFSKIRQHFGNNNKPNVIEFKSSMKQMLLKNSISSSYAANCIEMHNSCVESIFEIRWSKRNSDDLLNIEYEEESNLSDFLIDETDQSRIIKDIILYDIAGYIARKLLK